MAGRPGKSPECVPVATHSAMTCEPFPLRLSTSSFKSRIEAMPCPLRAIIASCPMNEPSYMLSSTTAFGAYSFLILCGLPDACFARCWSCKCILCVTCSSAFVTCVAFVRNACDSATVAITPAPTAVTPIPVAIAMKWRRESLPARTCSTICGIVISCFSCSSLISFSCTAFSFYQNKICQSLDFSGSSCLAITLIVSIENIYKLMH